MNIRDRRNERARTDCRRFRSSTLPRSGDGCGPAIDDAIARVLEHCQFILGPEVREFEAELAAFCGAKHAVTCASGTDALVLALRARGIGPGDAVICPSFTFCATAEVAVLVGATPVFVDVDAETFNIDAAEPRRARSRRRSAPGLKPKAVIPVDLFGLPADHDAIAAVAKARRPVRARRRRAGVRRHATRAAARHVRRTPPRPASFRPSRSAATATAARC